MAHLGRIRLFVKTIRKFMVNLKRHHAPLYQELGDRALRYEEKNDGQFAVKPSESVRTLQEVGDDCFFLVERFKANDAVSSMSSYQLLVRLLSEQCVVDETKSGSPVGIKPNKEVVRFTPEPLRSRCRLLWPQGQGVPAAGDGDLFAGP
jgi:hypothetical protein